jgi:outer membrane biosynthesis protein TonB
VPAPVVVATVTPTSPTRAKAHGAAKAEKTAKAKPEETKLAAAAAPAPAADPKGAAKPAQPGDPSFDELLKEAGVQDGAKKAAAPKLAKKALTGDDITNGMSALSAKAQACYKGTQGTAMVKLIVAPSGKVTKVSVGGAFAGKPEGSCVANIAQSATFPPWDGGPQTVNYSYLLSE